MHPILTKFFIIFSSFLSVIYGSKKNNKYFFHGNQIFWQLNDDDDPKLHHTTSFYFQFQFTSFMSFIMRKVYRRKTSKIIENWPRMVQSTHDFVRNQKYWVRLTLLYHIINVSFLLHPFLCSNNYVLLLFFNKSRKWNEKGFFFIIHKKLTVSYDSQV